MLTTLDTEQGETSHGWPFIIPGREAVVFVIYTSAQDGQLAVLDLATGDVTQLGLAGFSPRYGVKPIPSWNSSRLLIAYAAFFFNVVVSIFSCRFNASRSLGRCR